MRLFSWYPCDGNAAIATDLYAPCDRHKIIGNPRMNKKTTDQSEEVELWNDEDAEDLDVASGVGSSNILIAARDQTCYTLDL